MNKQVVLVMVEGITDKTSLEVPINSIIGKNNKLEFQVVSGDITTDKNVSINNIKSKITEKVKDGGKRKYKNTDYKEIVHIVDLDGVYLHDDMIVENSYVKGFQYHENLIYNHSKQKVVERNRKKREMLDVLIATKFVFKVVPYRVFFFSCNLEHVLHDKLNISDNEKMNYAYNFEDEYYEDSEGFINFMCKSSFALKMNYSSSWNYIKTVDDRIERCTNFDIFIKDYASVKN